MKMTHLTYVELNAGVRSNIEAGSVKGETVARIAPWLGAALASGLKTPLPYSVLAEHTALAAFAGSVLVVTISDSGNGPGGVVTLGVVKDQPGGDQLWPVISKGTLGAKVALGLQQPETPWAAVSYWPRPALQPEVLQCLDDIARSIAWVWNDPQTGEMFGHTTPSGASAKTGATPSAEAPMNKHFGIMNLLAMILPTGSREQDRD
jgi:hypothetical protein